MVYVRRTVLLDYNIAAIMAMCTLILGAPMENAALVCGTHVRSTSSGEGPSITLIWMNVVMRREVYAGQ